MCHQYIDAVFSQSTTPSSNPAMSCLRTAKVTLAKKESQLLIRDSKPHVELNLSNKFYEKKSTELLCQQVLQCLPSADREVTPTHAQAGILELKSVPSPLFTVAAQGQVSVALRIVDDL
eukprot:11175454-Lingulodinium_polyedra.AAC.1